MTNESKNESPFPQQCYSSLHSKQYKNKTPIN